MSLDRVHSSAIRTTQIHVLFSYMYLQRVMSNKRGEETWLSHLSKSHNNARLNALIIRIQDISS